MYTLTIKLNRNTTPAITLLSRYNLYVAISYFLQFCVVLIRIIWLLGHNICTSKCVFSLHLYEVSFQNRIEPNFIKVLGDTNDMIGTYNIFLIDGNVFMNNVQLTTGFNTISDRILIWSNDLEPNLLYL